MSLTRYSEDNGRVIKYLIFPLLIIFIFMTITLTDFFYPGIIGLILLSFSMIVYYLPQFKEEVIGINQKTAFISTLFGIGLTVMFYIANKTFPSMAIAFPVLNLSINQDIRWFLIVIAFPIAEEIFFRSALMGSIIEIYKFNKKNEWKANVAQAVIFSFFHLLAYGVALGAYDKWKDAFGATTAISGLLFSAFIMAMVWGYVSRKDGVRNLLFNISSHILVNQILFTASVVFLG